MTYITSEEGQHLGGAWGCSFSHENFTKGKGIIFHPQITEKHFILGKVSQHNVYNAILIILMNHLNNFVYKLINPTQLNCPTILLSKLNYENCAFQNN